MSIIEEHLRALRDLEAVQGSAVFSSAGALIARDLPPNFDAALLHAIGARLALLFEAFSADGEELDGCVLRFGEHSLYLRRVSWGVLCVLTGREVNASALRMAINLVLRRLDSRAHARSAPALPDSRLASAPPLAGQSLPGSALPGLSRAGSSPPEPRQPGASRAGRAAQEERSVQPPLSLLQAPIAGAAPVHSEGEGGRHVRMYRGRRVLDE